MENCTFKPEDTEPCENCPRLISAFYMCGLLQDALKDDESEDANDD